MTRNLRAAALTREPYGATRDGEEVELVTLASRAGVVVEILTYGGIVRRVLAPDRYGDTANVALGLETLDDYLEDNSGYFGALVGRFANRLAGATFELDGTTHRVDANEGSHALHGGTRGFDRCVWEPTVLPVEDDRCGLELRRTSPAGEMGYPGALSVVVTYSLTAAGTLRIDYRAETDAPTIVNLTSHGYWNLAGEGSGPVDGHVLWLAAGRYTPYDAELIPTGAIAPVAGTPFDFTRPRPLGARCRRDGGYDVNFVLDRSTRDGLERAAELHDPVSGRALAVWTTEPGLQLYAGHLLDGTRTGTDGRPHETGFGVALETQHFPDSPHRPAFPSVVLRPGGHYRSATEYRLSVPGVERRGLDGDA